MSWRYIPAVRIWMEPGGDFPEVEWSIREIHDLNGKVGWTAEAIDPVGESREGLIETLQRMLAAVEDGKDYLNLDSEKVEPYDPDHPF